MVVQILSRPVVGEFILGHRCYIRGVEGVTIVKALETLEKPLHNTTRMSIKIDGEYLPEGSIDSILEQVRSEALAIPGVVRFTYVTLPEL